MEWSKEQGLGLVGGRGRKRATLYLTVEQSGAELKPLYIYEDGERSAVLHLYFSVLGA